MGTAVWDQGELWRVGTAVWDQGELGSGDSSMRSGRAREWGAQCEIGEFWGGWGHSGQQYGIGESGESSMRSGRAVESEDSGM